MKLDNLIASYAIKFILLYPIFMQLSSSSSLSSVPELIRSDGYEVQEHEVLTDDGYILGHHRIPSRRFENYSREEQKPVVVLGHCSQCSSGVYIVLGPTRALAYKLSNEGYDVWMLNSRGTSYSRRHLNMSPKSLDFWKFGLHEQAIYDLRASIDYILKVTNQSQIDYIGFSMGCTHLFILLAEKPEYNEKIRSGITLAPAVFINSSTGLWKDINPYSSFIIDFSLASNNLEIPNPDYNVKNLALTFCNSDLILFKNICLALLTPSGAEDNGNLDLDLVPFFLKYFPESISVRQAAHFSQWLTSGKFEKFNFGYRKNMVMYGKATPPLYDLSKVTAPISIFWAGGDRLTPPADILRLKNNLQNVPFYYQVPFPSFSHMDFVWGKNVHSLVYDKVLEKLKMPETYKRI